MPPPFNPCPQCCCAAGVCCRSAGGREKALAKMLRDKAGTTDAVLFASDGDMYDTLAAAVYEEFDLVPKGVGAAIVAGYEPYFHDMHEKRARGNSEE